MGEGRALRAEVHYVVRPVHTGRARCQGGATPRDTVGASGGLSVAQQLYNHFDAAGMPLKAGEIAIVDAALSPVRRLQ